MEKLVKILKPEKFAEIENDGYVKVKDLKKGDVFYECENGSNFELIVIENPVYSGSGWTCWVEDSAGFVSEVYVHRRYQKFTRFYKYPQYLEEVENKGLCYVIK